MNIQLDTQATVYVATNATEGVVYALRPKSGRCEQVEHLRLDEPDPYGPDALDAHAFELLRNHPDMDETRIEI